MEELKIVFAANLIRLRTEAGLTQLQLAEQLNYSDKSVSKWERGDALPDVVVMKAMADLFGVTVDFLITSHDEWNVRPVKRHIDTNAVTAISAIGIWLLAALIFVIFWMNGRVYWVIFMAALPVMLVTWLVLNSVWRKGYNNRFLVAALIVSVFGLLSFVLWRYELLILLIPSLLIAWLSFQVYKKEKNKKGNKP
ncbi:MAG: helix-turn-helix transcriptional regulator [Clostridia bacterium]|nr:helix-turn-helix transcriptional regulator [Clostridia bacterium]